MRAAQNAQRWAINQRRKSRAAAAASVQRADDELRLEITRLQNMATMMEGLPAMAKTRTDVLARIASLQASFFTTP
jgi:hypothetical protein